ncbi:MAG: hypothetical protein ACR2GW_03925 [Pyrinomonadaceae bacterium]
MRMCLLRLASLCVVPLMLAAIVHAQESASQQIVAPLPQGGFVAFKIRTTPLNADISGGGSESELRLPLVSQVLADDGNVIHRLLVDEQGVLVFGYDLVVEPLAANKTFKVSARPLARQFEARLRERSVNAPRTSQTPFTFSTLTNATDIQTVADGETFALDLLINEQLGLKIVDYVKVAAEKSRLFAPGAAPPARDFAITNVELAVNNYQLHIDGDALRTASARRSCTGALVWFSLPERGRFIFSLAPHEGYNFQKLGMIEDNKISFTWKGVRYEWISETPIVGSGGAWNLWVLHDPDYMDVFAPPTIKGEQESKLARVLRDPLGRSAASAIDRSGVGLQGERQAASAKRPTSERVRVRIGGADKIETLLPKN